ncbi:membrane fusion protein, multidrug efflux system [Pustulibacterium marinum]|uniref:Membrane fusion protein, multidrug efflux system n=1 Tax=Pustulibacterium marinum TaxID=1224947 RepID=A0A1I7HB95_9FLAO|nr:HlyD family secretion protein [Pustulibacterium marinum]SFU57862.1 membrane fusion protein, multidrug efflux system [Pustulibacterium marinum]
MSEELKKFEKTDRIVVKITYLVALFIFIGLIIWGVMSTINHWRYEYTNDAQVQEYINPILSRANGYVQEIKYKDHQQVQKGDTLVVLDRNEAMVQKQLAEAALSAAEAQLKVLQSNRNTANSSSSINQAQIDAAQAQLWQQQKEFERYKNLLENDAVTQQHFEDIQTKLKVAEANVESMKRTYKTSLSKTNDVSAQIEVAKATIAEKKAALNQIDLDLKYAVITAPTNGYMGKKNLQIGQLVQKGQTIGFIVDQNQGKWIVANFEETQIAEIHVGQEAEIKIDAYPNQRFHGTIESFSPATGSQFSLLPPDNATGNFVKITQRFPVRIQFKDDEKALVNLRAGMNAEVEIPKS